ncbi:hypothetical protein D3C85_1821510 [compost metagenome]
MRPHEIGQSEAAFRRTDEQRTSFFDAGNIFAREVAIAEQAAAIGIRFQRFIEQNAK